MDSMTWSTYSPLSLSSGWARGASSLIRDNNFSRLVSSGWALNATKPVCGVCACGGVSWLASSGGAPPPGPAANSVLGDSRTSPAWTIDSTSSFSATSFASSATNGSTSAASAFSGSSGSLSFFESGNPKSALNISASTFLSSAELPLMRSDISGAISACVVIVAAAVTFPVTMPRVVAMVRPAATPFGLIALSSTGANLLGL